MSVTQSLALPPVTTKADTTTQQSYLKPLISTTAPTQDRTTQPSFSTKLITPTTQDGTAQPSFSSTQLIAATTQDKATETSIPTSEVSSYTCLGIQSVCTLVYLIQSSVAMDKAATTHRKMLKTTHAVTLTSTPAPPTDEGIATYTYYDVCSR